MSITKEKKEEAIGEFQREASDTGSPEVQIAILTTRINNLTGHMQKNKKDYATRRGLLAMVSRRRRLLDYIKRHDPQKYLDMLARLGIRK
jgi:small subunit ribosomal protein S15